MCDKDRGSSTMSIPDIDADEQGSCSGDVDFAQLLSTCIDACRRGCEVIRNVRQLSLQSTDILDSVQYKIHDDPRSALTEADGASQKVIVECLNSCWEKEIESGLVKVVGEEDEDHYSTDLEGERSFDTAFSEDIMAHFDNYNCPRPDFEPIQRDMFDHTEGSAQELSSKSDRIIIFIDPMDGTREFVEGRIQNVQCLIGITLNGMPVAGAMGLPMVHGNHIEIAYGLLLPRRKESQSSEAVPLLSGVKMFDARNSLHIHPVMECFASDSSESDDSTLRVYSGDSKKPVLKLAMDCLENNVAGRIEPGNVEEVDSNDCHLHPPMRKIVAGGCGNKILSVQRHFQSLHERQQEKDPSTPALPLVGAISLAPPGSSSWDTAAPTAVLLAADPEARITDLFGLPLIYDGEHLLNDCGVVVSSGHIALRIHERLCKGLCNDPHFCEVLGVELQNMAPVDTIEVRSDATEILSS